MSPLRVGLTGGIGSGKSVVAELFAELGAPIIDTDQLARNVVAPGSPLLAQISLAFGYELLLPDGNLDRARLAAQIFANPAQKRQLESLLHPAIAAAMQEEIAVRSGAAPYLILAIPLLVEAGWQDRVDRILVVDCPEAVQLERASRRDQRSVAAIEQIIAQQASREERLRWADDIIDNGPNRDRSDLAAQVRALDQNYRAHFGKGVVPSPPTRGEG